MMSNKEWVIVDKTKLTAIADTVRATTKSESSIEIDDLSGEVARAIQIGSGLNTYDATADASEIMLGETAYANGMKVTGTFTIDEELNNQDNLITQIATTLRNKSANTGTDADGVELPTLSNPAIESEVFLNKEVIDEQGNVKTGTFTIDTELSAQNDLIAQIQSAVDGLPEAGEQIAPEISINSSSGLITATAGNTISTYQMAFQGAKTITPSIVTQVAISSGHYAGGSVVVNGDSNLIPANIISGKTIFGVSGTASAGDGINEEEVIAGFLEIVPAVIENSVVTKLRKHAFANCSTLTSVNFPACTTIGNSVFLSCSHLTSINFPTCTYIGYEAFADCSTLTSTNFPACTYIQSYAFKYCSALTSVNFPVCSWVGGQAFWFCYSLASATFLACMNILNGAFILCRTLSSLQLGASSVCKLSNSIAFSSTPFAGYSSYFSGTPHIYVPASLVSAYQSATNWTYFSSYFSSIESLENN